MHYNWKPNSGLNILGNDPCGEGSGFHGAGSNGGNGGNGGDSGISPGFCACGKPVENRDTGKCGSCGFAARKMERRAKTPRKKPVRIRSRSKKTSALDAIYSRLRAEWLPGKKCAVYPALDATEIHHMKGRTGYADAWARQNNIPLLIDVRYFLPVSNLGHTKITNQSAWASKNGYTLTRSN